MARKYTVNSGLSSLAASTTKVACQLATGAAVTNTLLGLDIAFDSTATGAAAIPVRVQLARASTASSGGATATPNKWSAIQAAAVSTGRANDTTAGTLTAVIKEWLVSPTSGFSYQFPLGREIEMGVSEFLELRVVSQAGMTTCNYIANIDMEE